MQDSDNDVFVPFLSAKFSNRIEREYSSIRASHRSARPPIPIFQDTGVEDPGAEAAETAIGKADTKTRSAGNGQATSGRQDPQSDVPEWNDFSTDRSHGKFSRFTLYRMSISMWDRSNIPVCFPHTSL